MWKRRERRVKWPKAEAIAAKLGLLKKGDSTWWRNHHQAAAALAELLGCDIEELLSSPTSTASEIAFAEFPALRPLSLNEDPCFLSSHGWLGAFAARLLQQGRHAWIVASPGSGKTLAIETVRLGYSTQVCAVTTRTLSEAVGEAKSGLPLLVEVEFTDAATDDVALVELTRRRTNTCILAPFRRPTSSSDREHRWQDTTWEPEEGWRERLVRWVQGRLPDPDTLDVGEFLDWLTAIDPSGTMTATPGELLPLLAWTYRHGPPKKRTKLSTLADEWHGLVFAASRQHPWLQHHGRRAVHGLLRRRIENLDLRRSPLPIEIWANLLPSEVTPSVPGDEIRRQLDAVAKGRSALDRQKKAAEASAALSTSKPLEAIHLLAEHGILRTQSDGQLDIFPTWARVALERQVFFEAIKSGDSKTWGLWEVDESRRLAVDGALDEVSPRELLGLAPKVLREPEAELHTVAAIEALFSACGRRMLQGWEPTEEHVPILQELGLRQMKQLAGIFDVVEFHDEPPLPLTRRSSSYDDAWRAQWLAEAWMFSLKVPPREFVPREARWHLPGWVRDLSLAEPLHLPFPPVMPRESAADTPYYLRWIGALREVLGRCVDDQPPERLTYAFLPWLFIDGPARGWNPTQEHYRDLCGSRAAGITGSLLDREPREVQIRAVAALWPLLVTQGGSNPVQGLLQLGHADQKLADLVATTIPTNVFEQDLGSARLDRAIGSHLKALPQRLRRSTMIVVARQIRTSGIHGPLDFEHFLTDFGAEDTDILVEFAAERFQLGHEAAKRVWSLDPERALAESRAALVQKEDERAGGWFLSAPRAAEQDLLDLIEAHGKRPIRWAARWLARMLPVAGKEAPRVYRLLHKVESE